VIFKSNPTAALDKTRRKLGDVEANIADLKTKRASLLAEADADNIGEVQAVNKHIEAEQAAAEIYRDKIKALQEECRKVTYAEREGQRAKQIEKIKERLTKREETAAALQLAINRVGHLYTELMANDEVESLWKFPHQAGFAAIDRRGVNREVSWLLYGLTRVQRVPEPSSAFAGVIGVQAIGIDGVVRAQNAAIVSRLSTAPIHTDLLDETA
jgi:hypothetical protein